MGFDWTEGSRTGSGCWAPRVGVARVAGSLTVGLDAPGLDTVVPGSGLDTMVPGSTMEGVER